MKFSKKILIGVIAFILILTVAYTVIFIYKGSYPTEIYMALVPTCVTELIILYKLKINGGDDNDKDRGTTGRDKDT